MQMSEIPMQHHYNIIAFTALQTAEPDINVRMTELLELKYCLLQDAHHNSDAFNCSAHIDKLLHIRTQT